jgi:hypothetical protein
MAASAKPASRTILFRRGVSLAALPFFRIELNVTRLVDTDHFGK